MTEDVEKPFREALATFATGITVVTTRDRDGTPRGLTVNSFSSVSLVPRLISWCIDHQSDCFDVFSRADHFAVHVLKNDQRELALRFARPDAGKFNNLPLGANSNGTPTLADYAACFHCTTEHRYPAGDHVILVGRVDAFDRRGDGGPLIYYKGDYFNRLD